MTRDGDAWVAQLGEASVSIRRDSVAVSLAGQKFDAHLIAPSCSANETPVPDVIEWGSNYAWLRLLSPDAAWPRIIEVKMDVTGNIEVTAHVQRLAKGDATAPELGWHIASPPLASASAHSFAEGQPFSINTADNTTTVTFPNAASYRRGRVDATADSIKYIRCSAEEKVPFQESAWRSASFHVCKAVVSGQAADVRVEQERSQDLQLWPVLQDLQIYTRKAIVASMLYGADFGNVTAFSVNGPAAVFGMNRLNHCGAIFEEAARTGDAGLRDVAVDWCSNMYDLSTWWADTDEFGGTRYNNATAAGSKD
jgi:hypothetical protein